MEDNSISKAAVCEAAAALKRAYKALLLALYDNLCRDRDRAVCEAARDACEAALEFCETLADDGMREDEDNG